MVFGGDAGSVGGADGGGTVGAVVGGGRHEDGAAGNDVGDDFGSIVGGENEWIMPEGGTVGEATATAEGVVAVGINDGVGCCRGWFGSEGGLAEAAVVGNGRRKW